MCDIGNAAHSKARLTPTAASYEWRSIYPADQRPAYALRHRGDTMDDEGRENDDGAARTKSRNTLHNIVYAAGFTKFEIAPFIIVLVGELQRE